MISYVNWYLIYFDIYRSSCVNVKIKAIELVIIRIEWNILNYVLGLIGKIFCIWEIIVTNIVRLRKNKSCSYLLVPLNLLYKAD